MLKKYVGPYEVEVFVLGQSYGIVSPGDSVSVPDEIAAQSEWGDVWEDVKPVKEHK